MQSTPDTLKSFTANLNNIFYFDFCVVSPHCAGLQSFLYYLYKMNAPSSIPWGVATTNSWEALRVQYPVCGRTIEKAQEAHSIDAALRPVFWLVRDPIALIACCVNQTIGDTIYTTFSGAEVSYEGLCVDKNLLYFIMDKFKYFCCYGDQLQSLSNHGAVQVIDTSDLLPNKIHNTMQKVCECLNVPYAIADKKMYEISYNKFSNRIWTHMSPCKLDSAYGTNNYYIYPTELYEFITYHKNQDVATALLRYNNKNYTAVTTELLGKIKLTPDSLENAVRTIRLRTKLITAITDVYQEHVIPKEYIIDYMKSKPALLKTFLAKQRSAIDLLEKYAPEVLASWKYFNQLL